MTMPTQSLEEVPKMEKCPVCTQIKMFGSVCCGSAATPTRPNEEKEWWRRDLYRINANGVLLEYIHVVDVPALVAEASRKARAELVEEIEKKVEEMGEEPIFGVEHVLDLLSNLKP